MRVAAMLVLGLAAVVPRPTLAQDFQWHGFLDVRAVSTGDEPNWTEGGLGKLRWSDHGGPARFGGAVLQGTGQFSPAWFGLASLQYQSSDRPGLELIEAYLRYRPVSTSPWRWSFKAGVFFPPVSLENDGIGWTSPYTLTPSAINSWVGEELRDSGVEVRLEKRGENITVEGALAAFAGNDPAGEMIAARGWSLSDRVYGLGASLREPDLAAFEDPPPRRYDPFVETDHRLGWHAEVRVSSSAYGQLRLIRYDNRADPSSFTTYEGQEIYSWRTRFWGLAAQTRFGDYSLIGQGLVGDTEIVPSPFFHTRSDFWSAFLLLAREQGRWRPAVRIESFGARQGPESLTFRANEHGRALTAALNWQPQSWLRLSGEVLAIDSARTERRLLGQPERATELQLQLALRLFF